MTDMKVSQLNVDLLQDQATIALSKQIDGPEVGRFRFMNVLVNTPVYLIENQSELHLKWIAIEEAKKVLQEALQALNRHDLAS